jgi:ATP phosphoribosyltransferase
MKARNISTKKNRYIVSCNTAKILDQNNIKAEIHTISGSVEIAPNIGLADGICESSVPGVPCSERIEGNARHPEIRSCSGKILTIDREQEAILKKLFSAFNRFLGPKKASNILMNVPNDKMTRSAASFLF